MARRRYLFLQGPIGPFIGQVGLALQKAGHTVYRINFNGGDKRAWPLPGAIDYLVKPYDDERFEEAFRRARRKLELEGLDRLRDQLLALEPSPRPADTTRAGSPL